MCLEIGLITSEELMMCLKHKEVDEEIMHNKKEHSLESFSGYSYRNAMSGSKRYEIYSFLFLILFQ